VSGRRRGGMASGRRRLGDSASPSSRHRRRHGGGRLGAALWTWRLGFGGTKELGGNWARKRVGEIRLGFSTLGVREDSFLGWADHWASRLKSSGIIYRVARVKRVPGGETRASQYNFGYLARPPEGSPKPVGSG
jgi:hypothetical protein